MTAALTLLLLQGHGTPGARRLLTAAGVLAASLALAAVMALLDLAGATIGLP